jgi:ABC-2 type transport system ATP-binding protein
MAYDGAAISVRDLRVTYGSVVALDGIALDLEWAQPVAILGPNGAGKTTLIYVLTTMMGHFQGQARVAGLDVRRDARQARRIIGLMPQENNLYEPVSGLDNLMLQGALHGLGTRAARERALEVLERVGLSEVARRKVSTYSGGMKRRLVYARAMMHRPQIMFLDEPTTGLDVQSRHALWEDIGAAVTERRSIVLTTHYIEEAERFCRRIVVVDKGRVVADGSPESLMANGEKSLEEVIINLAKKEWGQK